MTESPGSELQNYLNVIRQHHFKIVLAFLLTSGAALTASFYLPPTYESSTLLEVQSPAQPSPISTNLFQSVFSGGLNRGELETLVRRFTTESLLMNTVDSLEATSNPGADYLPSIGRLRASVHARVVPETSYISVSARFAEEHGGERNAALIVNRLVRTLQEWRVLEDRQRATSRRAIVENRLTQLNTDLEVLQQELLKAMQKDGSPATWYPLLTSLLERQKEIVTATRSRTISLETTLQEQMLTQERLEDQPEFERMSETISVDPVWSSLRTQQLTIEGEIAEAKTRYGDATPELRGLLEKQKTLKHQFEEAVQDSVRSTTYSVSPIYLDLLQTQWALEGRILRMREEIRVLAQEEAELEEELQALLESLPGQQYHFDLLKRKIEALYSILVELQKQSVDAEIMLAEAEPLPQKGPYQPQGGIAVVDRAQPRRAAIAPNRRFIVVIGALVGAGLGFMWILASEFASRSLAASPKRAQDGLPKNS